MKTDTSSANTQPRFDLEYINNHGVAGWWIEKDGIRIKRCWSLNEAKKELWKMKKDTINSTGQKSGSVPSFSKPLWMIGKKRPYFSVK